MSAGCAKLGARAVAKPKKPQRPEPKRDEFLRNAFADVEPLADRHRQAPRPMPKRRAEWRRASAGLPAGPAPGVHFVLEREEEYVSGYRSDLGPQVLAPLKSARWQPQATLDFHGYRTSELQKELVLELGRAIDRGISRLLIVHGKGLHSEGGIGVLAAAVVDALTEGRLAASVRALKTAPIRLGGSGALAVELERAGRY